MEGQQFQSHQYLSVDHFSPSDTPKNKRKAARSHSQISQQEGNSMQLKRVKTKVEVISNQQELIREQVRSERQGDKSMVYSLRLRGDSLSRGISIVDESEDLGEPIEITSFLAWLILIFSSICNAVVPCWMTVDVNSQGLTRSAWRLFTTSILLLPFVLYQQRNIRRDTEKFLNLLTRQNLQKHFIFSINYSVWVLFGTLALRLTARSHSFSFLRLKFFFISLRKFFKREEYYQSQMGGVLLVGIASGMIFWDSYNLPVQDNPLAFYLSYTPLMRFSGDLLAIVGSVALLYFESNYSMPKSPHFSNLFIHSVCVSINLVVFGYFFGGNEFTFHPVRGVFGMLKQQNFVSIFYVSIMLGLNLIISNLLVDKIFSQFIRNVASCLQPVITVSIYHAFSIEVLTPGTTALGLAFFVPGMMLIVGGQNYLKKEEIKVNFLIYKQEEKHFFQFARRSYRDKLEIVQPEEEEGDEEEEEEESGESEVAMQEEKQKVD